MKTNLKTTGIIQIDFNKDLFLIIKDYVARTQNLLVTKIQRNENNIVAFVEGGIEEGAQPFGTEPRAKIERKSNKGFRKNYTGFYPAVREIIESLKGRKKNFISLEDLHAELLGVAGDNGKPRFEGIPLSRVQQYLTKSQLIKNNVKGVKVSEEKGNRGLKF